MKGGAIYSTHPEVRNIVDEFLLHDLALVLLCGPNDIKRIKNRIPKHPAFMGAYDLEGVRTFREERPFHCARPDGPEQASP